MNIKKTISRCQQIKTAVLKSGLSIPQIAKRADINKATLYNYLRGRSEMNPSNMERVMKTLGMNIPKIISEKSF